MSPPLLWIGFESHLIALSASLEVEYGINFKEVPDASSGLEAVARNKYPLILVNDNVPAGNLRLPRYNPSDDLVRVSCYTIERIRSIERDIQSVQSIQEIREIQDDQKREIPIVVTHLGIIKGYDLGKAIEMYKRAGATECFNCYYGPSSSHLGKVISEFGQLLARYL
jgi:hypothetical protein